MIAMLMESLREQTQTIASYEGRIPQIEIDIVMSNLRKVYDYCATLNLLNQGQGMVRLDRGPFVSASDQSSDNQQEPTQAPALKSTGDELPEQPADPAKGDISVDEPASLSPDIENEEETKQEDEAPVAAGEEVATDVDKTSGDSDVPPVLSAKDEEVAAPVNVRPEPVPDKKPAESGPLFSGTSEPTQPVSKPDTRHAKVSEPDLFGFAPTLADTLQPDSRPLVADRFAGKAADQNLASRLGSKNIADMKEAIGINDKFLLINELFKGNQHHYNQALHFLNNAESFDEAMGMFSRMFTELKWNSESKAVEKLRSLIERRHGIADH